MRLIIITGASGAGKSVALKACEDFGFVCMDNLPMPVVASVIDAVGTHVPQLAICSDVRSPAFDAEAFLQEVTTLKARYDCTLIFLTSARTVLLSRYNATKHRHPLYEGDSLMESLEREEALLAPLRMAADAVVDTSDYTPHMLKGHLAHLAGIAHAPLAVRLVSFSYQKGLPHNADLVFDVRFLKNPHYDALLRPQTGRDAEVAAFIEQDTHLAPYMQGLHALLDMLLPLYQREGKSYLTIAFGCTGGQHRSVYVVERMQELLATHISLIEVFHRDAPS
jgi:RNase adapter protein RapZ